MGIDVAEAMSGPRRAAIYARVSTARQVDSGTSLDDQRVRTTARADADGYDTTAEFVDAGESGAKADRPGLTELLTAARHGAIDVVYATKIDRLARSLRDLLRIVDALTDAGVGLVLLDDPLDTSSAAGRMAMQMMGSVAEFEHSLIQQRLLTAQERTAEAGGWPGGKAPFGWRLEQARKSSRHTTLAIDPPQAEAVRRLQRMICTEGATTAHVAEDFNVCGPPPPEAERWTPGMIRQIIAQSGPGWSGQWPWRRPRTDGDDPDDTIIVEVPAILTSHQHDALKAVVASRTTRYRKPRTFSLAGKLTSEHGVRMLGLTPRGVRRYRCAWRRKGTRPPDQPQCDCLNVDAQIVETAVWDEVVAMLTDPDAIEAIASHQLGQATDSTDTIADLDRRIADREAELSEAYAAAVEAGMSSINAAIAVKGISGDLDDLRAARENALAVRAATHRSRAAASALADAATTARERLDSTDERWRQHIYDVLKLEVAVVDHVTCESCGGSGRDGSTRCTTCCGMSTIPQLRVDGAVPDALRLAVAGADVTAFPGAPGDEQFGEVA